MEIENDTKPKPVAETENVDLAQEQAPELSPFEQRLLESGIYGMNEPMAPALTLTKLKRALGMGGGGLPHQQSVKTGNEG